jgi:hypothetical protein
MPLTSNKLGKNATWFTTANVTIALTDLSSSYDGDQTGTVAITATVNVVGTGTSFTTDFSNGDFIRAVVNSTVTDVRVINQVVNATFINVTSNWTAANSSTTYGKSETVERVNINGVKFTSNGSWTVARGSNTVMVLHGTDNFDFSGNEQSLSTDSSGTIVVTHTVLATGTLVLELSKKSRVSNNRMEPLG